MLLSLSSIIETFGEDKELLQRFLSSFSCCEDRDIESFLHSRAIEFELLSKARTYLVCEQEDMENKPFDHVTIYGYVSVALKVLSIPDGTSNRMRKIMDGYSPKIHGEIIRDIPCYLIGQLARNSSVSKSAISGAELLDYAYGVIAQAVEAVGGRYIMIECLDNAKLVKFYESNDFKILSKINDGERPMIQMIRKLY